MIKIRTDTHWKYIILFGILLLFGCAPVTPTSIPIGGGNEVTPTIEVVSSETSSNPQEQPRITPVSSVDPAAWVWVVNETDKTVLRIDPTTNNITATLEMNGKPEIAVAGEGAVWVIEQGANGGSHIVRIDPNPSWPQITARLPIVKGTAVSIAPGAGSVWVGIAEPLKPAANTSTEKADLPGGLLRIDPLTNQPASYSAQNTVPAQILVDGTSLWALDWTAVQSLFNHYNLTNGEHVTLPTVVDSPASVYQFSRMAVNPTGLWAISTDINSRFIYKINPADGKIIQLIPAGLDPTDHPVDLVAGNDAIWVALENGKVIRIDPVDGAVNNVTELSDHLARIFLADNSVWVENRMEAQLYRINPQNNQVIAVISTGSKLSATSTPLPRKRPGAECKPSYDSRLVVGGRAIVKGDPPLPNRVRAEPRIDSEFLGQIMPDDGMTLLEGPVCVKNWLWWKVIADGSNLIGWTAEGDEKGYWLSPVSTK